MLRYINVILIIVSTLLLVSCDVNNNDFENKLKFQYDQLIVPEKELPELFSQIQYSTYSSEGENVILHYVFDDTLLYSFKFNKLNEFIEKQITTLPKKQKKYISNFSIVKLKKKFILCDNEGQIYGIENDSISLLCDFNKILKSKHNNLRMSKALGKHSELDIINNEELLIRLEPILRSKFNKSNLVYNPYRMFALFNLKTHKIKLLNYWAPSHYLKFDYGYYNNHYSTRCGDTIIVSYAYKDQVDLFSISQNKYLGEIEFCSKYKLKDTPKSSKGNSEERYRIEAPYYGPILYNKELNCFYRIFYHSLGTFTKNDNYTILSDKRSSIIVSDKNFQFLSETMLKKDFFHILSMSPNKEGLIFNLNIKVDKEYFKITRLTQYQ